MRAPTRKSAAAEAARFNAHDRFKQRSRSWTWIGLSIATVIHFLLLAFMPFTRRVDTLPEAREARPLRAIRLLARIAVPPPPDPIARLAPPILPDMAPIGDFEVEPVELADEVIGSAPIPEPPTTVVSDEMAGFEYFVPSMVKPELVNREEVRRKLQREYPRHLQNVGIGGALVILFWIDEKGADRKSVV